MSLTTRSIGRRQHSLLSSLARLTVLLSICTVLLSACTDDSMPGATAPTIPITSYTIIDTFDISTVEPVATGEPDITFLRLSKAHPDFAGYYVKNGRLVVASRTGVIPSGLGLPATLKGQPLPHDVLSVEWSFDELARWRVPFVETLRAFRWQMIDIDEVRNRLVAMVADTAAVRKALTAAGVPSNVYILELSSTSTLTRGVASTNPRPPSPATMNCTTIHDKCRPVIGALHACFDIPGSSSREAGTIGFIIDHWRHGSGFITNSHLTPTIGVNDSISAYQGCWDAPAVATEVYDHPLIHRASLPAGVCPDTYCRYSDAAVFAFNDGVGSTLGEFAKLGSTGGAITARWQIDQEEDYPYVGQSVAYIGQVSGQVNTTIEQACADYKWYDVDNTSLLCQYKVEEAPQNGDSGAPVYAVLGPDEANTAILVGVMHSRAWSPVDWDGWFSSINFIKIEADPSSSLACDGIETAYEGGCGSSSGGGGGTGGGNLNDLVPGRPGGLRPAGRGGE